MYYRSDRERSGQAKDMKEGTMHSNINLNGEGKEALDTVRAHSQRERGGGEHVHVHGVAGRDGPCILTASHSQRVPRAGVF